MMNHLEKMLDLDLLPPKSFQEDPLLIILQNQRKQQKKNDKVEVNIMNSKFKKDEVKISSVHYISFILTYLSNLEISLIKIK